MKSASPRNTAVIVAGGLVGLVAMVAVAAGGTAIWADATQRDSNGYVSTNAHRYASPTRAIATDGVTIGSELPGWVAGKVRLEASSSKPVFVGIARKSDVDAYLAAPRTRAQRSSTSTRSRSPMSPIAAPPPRAVPPPSRSGPPRPPAPARRR